MASNLRRGPDTLRLYDTRHGRRPRTSKQPPQDINCSRSPATRLATAASASCDSTSVKIGASVSSRPCQRRAARSRRWPPG